MTIIIGKVESLKTLKRELTKRNINNFNSITDIKSFQKEYSYKLKEALMKAEYEILQEIKEHQIEIENNKNKIAELPSNLRQNIRNLKNEMEILSSKKTNLITKYFVKYKLKKKERKMNYYINNFDYVINKQKQIFEKKIKESNAAISYLTENKKEQVNKRSKKQIEKLNYINKTITELNPLIAGAIGENLVVKELSKLSDDYVLFNDFQLQFNPPIYRKQYNDRIFSIQIDHLLVARSGIFLIETKNWSKKSIESLNLWSPVEQIKRTSFALFVFLNSNKNAVVNYHHWGQKKIPIKNILVMINNKPNTDFKYVKVLNLKELDSYIEYFEPIFEYQEFKNIVNTLNDCRKYY